MLNEVGSLLVVISVFILTVPLVDDYLVRTIPSDWIRITTILIYLVGGTLLWSLVDGFNKLIAPYYWRLRSPDRMTWIEVLLCRRKNDESDEKT